MPPNPAENGERSDLTLSSFRLTCYAKLIQFVLIVCNIFLISYANAIKLVALQALQMKQISGMIEIGWVVLAGRGRG